jgi:hypothetical protein
MHLDIFSPVSLSTEIYGYVDRSHFDVDHTVIKNG